MFEPEEHVKGRCEGCEYRKRVHAQNNYSFYGCYYRPYSGKRVAEIKDCPKKIIGARIQNLTLKKRTETTSNT